MQKIRQDIKNGTYQNVYLLYGEENYLKNQYRDNLVKALCPDGEDMNFTRYEGKGLDENEIIGQAETMPFFADRRVILVENSGMFKNKAEQMADYLGRLPDYLVLIFVESEVDKRSRTFKAVQKSGYAAEFAEQTEETLTKWVLGRISRAGKRITRQDMEHFLTMTGSDMINIDSELEKLLTYTMDRDVITRADIDAVGAPQISNQIFDMVRAVTEHQQKAALNWYYDLLALKEPPMRILYLLARQFNQLLQIKEMQAAGLPNRDIASKIGMPPFAVSRSSGLCRRYSADQLRQIVEECVQTEQEVKTGHLDDTISVEMLIVKFSR